MNTITATFRVVTPMFLGGASPTEAAELRVPSLKGVLRFWWRAFQWGKVQDVADLRRQEADLFGSSDVGQSRFLVRLDAPVTETNTVQENWPPASWQRYTGYGLRDKGERKFIKPGREFALHLNLRRCGDEQRRQLIGALQLFGLAGGLGSRSRKGWGSVTLIRMQGSDWTPPGTPAEWEKAVAKPWNEPVGTSPQWTAFSSAAKWKAANAQPNAATAQQWLAKQYQTQVKSADPKAARAQFGLPREFKNGAPPRRERRASPLLLHIYQCPDGKALPTAIWLPATFLPNEQSIPGNGDSARQFVENLSSAQ